MRVDEGKGFVARQRDPLAGRPELDRPQRLCGGIEFAG
jgi:hypothetical protein